jgi:transcriptional regulator with XRE-family HTH domain
METIRAESDRLYAAIGQKIREARTRKSITQADLADAVALTRSSIANIERGKQKLLLHTFLHIAKALGTEPERLLPPEATPQLKPKVLVPHGLSEKNRELIEAAIKGKDRA